MIPFSVANNMSAAHRGLWRNIDTPHHVPEWCRTFNAGREMITNDDSYSSETSTMTAEINIAHDEQTTRMYQSGISVQPPHRGNFKHSHLRNDICLSLWQHYITNSVCLHHFFGKSGDQLSNIIAFTTVKSSQVHLGELVMQCCQTDTPESLLQWGRRWLICVTALVSPLRLPSSVSSVPAPNVLHDPITLWCNITVLPWTSTWQRLILAANTLFAHINHIITWIPMQDTVFRHSWHFKLPLHSAFCTLGELTVQCCQSDMYTRCYHLCTFLTNPNFTTAHEIHSNWCWNFMLSFCTNHWHSIMLYHSQSVSKLERNSSVSENSLIFNMCIGG